MQGKIPHVRCQEEELTSCIPFVVPTKKSRDKAGPGGAHLTPIRSAPRPPPRFLTLHLLLSVIAVIRAARYALGVRLPKRACKP